MTSGSTHLLSALKVFEYDPINGQIESLEQLQRVKSYRKKAGILGIALASLGAVGLAFGGYSFLCQGMGTFTALELLGGAALGAGASATIYLAYKMHSRIIKCPIRVD